MKNYLLSICTFWILLFSLPSECFSQTLKFGGLETFSIYTVSGAISNAHTSSITGNIGTNLGNVTGFDLPTTVSGSTHIANDTTNLGKKDLINAYITLNNIRVTNTTHAPAFGSGEVVNSGVYLIHSAGSVGGTITLDGQGNTNAVFIFKFEGAFTAGASTTVILTNEARSCNVFWISEGAISLAESVTMKGTLIAHPGAISMGPGCDIDGRLFSTSGAISMDEASVNMPNTMSSVPLNCQSAGINDINLGFISKFALFTSSGAASITGNAGIIGDVGANLGAVTGWDSSIVIGSMHMGDRVSNQAKIDLQSAYNQIYNTPPTDSTHPAVFADGEILTPGVYRIPSAVTLNGKLILDGQGNINSVFIFKFNGAFGTGAGTKIILINGARIGNIFWLAEGAISMGAFTFMKGTLIANNGSNNLAANGFLEGRMLSLSGAVGCNSATLFVNTNICSSKGPLPVTLTSFSGKCENQHTVLRWSTTTEINNKYFKVERSNLGTNWEEVGTVAGAGNSSIQHSYSITDSTSNKKVHYYYRLKQIDYDNNFKHSFIINVDNCEGNISDKMVVFPNPSSGIVNLSQTSNIGPVSSTQIFNSKGVKIYQSNIYKSQVDLSNQPTGVYMIRVVANSKIISSKIVLQK